MSGYYLVKLSSPTRGSPTIGQTYIIFVIREEDQPRTFVMNSAVTTYQAYNCWGGYSFYDCFGGTPLATQLSFDRPYDQNWGAGQFLDVYTLNYGQPGVPVSPRLRV